MASIHVARFSLMRLFGYDNKKTELDDNLNAAPWKAC